MDAPTPLRTHLVEISFDRVMFGEDLLRWSLEPWWHEEDHGPLDAHVAAELAELEGSKDHAQFSFEGHYVRALGVQTRVNVDTSSINLPEPRDPPSPDAPRASTLPSDRHEPDAGRWLLDVTSRVLRPTSPADFDMRHGVVRSVGVQVTVLSPLPVLTEEHIKALVGGVELAFSRDPDYWRPEDTRKALEAHVASVTVSDQTFFPGDLVAFENGARVTVFDASPSGIPCEDGTPGRRSPPGVVWFCEDVTPEKLGMEPELDDITVGHIRAAGGRKVGRVDDAVLKAILARRERERHMP